MSAMALEANLEEGAMKLHAKVRRPWCVFLAVVFAAVFLFAGGWSPLAFVFSQYYPKYTPKQVHLAAARPAAKPVAAAAATTAPTPAPVCGDGKCEAPENINTCLADCPGVTTPPMCGESPHSDPGGFAVADGRGHKAVSAADCCEKYASLSQS